MKRILRRVQRSTPDGLGGEVVWTDGVRSGHR